MGKVVRLEWEPVAADDLDSYSVRRSETPGGPYAVITVGVTTTSYVDHGALPDRTYFYVITALDGSSNESAISEERMIGPIPTGEAGREEAGRLVGR
jgi:large repetitive protein